MSTTDRDVQSRARRRELLRLQVWTVVAAVFALTFGLLAALH